jgi:hypothetical protein
MKSRHISIVSILAMSIAMAYPAAAQDPQVVTTPVAAAEAAKAPSATENLKTVKAMLTALQGNVSGTMNALNSLKKVAKEKAALEATYADFVAQYNALEAQMTALRQHSAATKSNTEEYFKSWQQSIASIQNKDIKETATDRFNTAKSRYNRVLATADEASKKAQPFLVDLKDIYTFLKVDTTADAVKSLSNTTWKLGRTGESVVDSINDVNKDIDIMLESLPKN